MHFRPADYVIYVFGGVRPTARAINQTAGSICRWRISKKRGGTGSGRIPSKAQMKILRVANRLNLDITAEDLINGRTI